MKPFSAFPAILALTLFCSCQKQQTEAERNEIERQVQQRLAAEHQEQDQKALADRVAALEAQRKTGDQQTTVAATEEKSPTELPADQGSTRPGHFTSMAQRMRDSFGRPATATYSTFYTRLEPDGDWFETPDYGYVWQPREARQSRAWRPYTNGHWLYSDAGWVWVSDEPFGWATYHYGRWTRLHDIGWIWVPGDEWAPAWVSWRKSNDYVGWAPLPPEARFERASGIHDWADNYYDIGPDQYCFIATREFGELQVVHAIVPFERNLIIVSQTTNVTNITFKNTTVMNQGPDYEELRSRTARPIERVHLDRHAIEAERDPRPVLKGDVLEVTAPIIASALSTEQPQRVKERMTRTVVDRGWEGIADKEAAEKIRMKLKSEASPPPDAPPKTFVKPGAAGNAVPTMTQGGGFTAPSPVPARRPMLNLPTGSPAPAASIPAVNASPSPLPMRHSGAVETPANANQPTGEKSATPAPSPSSTVAPRTSGPGQPGQEHGQFRSEALKRNPRLIVPMTSPSPQNSPAPAPPATTVPSTGLTTGTPAGEQVAPNQPPTRQERREERKEERRDLRRGGPMVSPTPSPR